MLTTDYNDQTQPRLRRLISKRRIRGFLYCAVTAVAIFTGVWFTFLSAAPVCDRNATDAASLATQFAAATSGETICLATGSYGSWTGGNKSVTVAAADGATPTMSLDFNNGDGNFTLDGITISTGSIVNSASNITIRNSTFTGILLFDNIYNANILLEDNTHNNIEFIDGNPAGRISFPYGDGATHSGVTIRDSVFRGGSADGIQTGVGVNIINNELDDIQENGHPTAHTDSIQLIGAYGSVVRGNYVHDGATGIVAYDEIAGVLIEHNVVTTDSRPEGIELYSDNGSIIQHNTVKGSIYLDHKPANPAGTGTVIKDNIATAIVKVGGSSTAEQTNNLLSVSSGEAGDVTGTPTYVGGSNPTSYTGFALANGSIGQDAASDGEDIGIVVAANAPDTTPPTAQITSPTDGATVQATVAITAAVSDNIGIAGVTFRYGSTIIGAEDTSFPYSVNWNTTGVSNGVYTLTATARDSSNNTTTSTGIVVTVDNNGATVARSLWNNTVTPATIDSGDTTAVELGLKFQSEVAGQITGVRFYKAAGNTGTHVGRLYSLDGTEMAQVTFQSETASGWQEALFSSPVSITANTTYMVTYHTTAGRYSVNGTYFASAPFDNYPLHAVQNGGASGMNGMFRYGSGGTMPDSNFNASNYWVDVVFEVPDTTPPAVNISAPAGGARVRGTVNIQATASDNVGVAGVQFKRGCPGSCVNIGTEDTNSPYALSWDTTSLTDGEYRLTATARDAAGNATTAANVTVEVDNTAPQTSITAQPVNPSNIASPGFTFTANETATFECKMDSANFSPCTSPISYTGLASGFHTFSVRATDSVGNVDASPATFSWEIDATAPTVSITQPTGGTVSGNAVTINANASDNRQLAGVQFWIDGVSVGAEDTASPYTMAWDSTKANNGAHTLSAVARDALGNTTTSTPVTVTVNNATSSPSGSGNPGNSQVPAGDTAYPPDDDTTPPILRNIQVTDIGADTATINWDSSEPATSIVVYRKQDSSNTTVTNVTRALKHKIILAELAANTTYYFTVEGTDEAGNETVSDVFNFTTLDGKKFTTQNGSSTRQPDTETKGESRSVTVPALITAGSLVAVAAAWYFFRARRP